MAGPVLKSRLDPAWV